MDRKKIIGVTLLATFLIVALTIVRAADVNITENIDIILTLDGQPVTFELLSGSGLNSFNVLTDRIDISTPVDGSATILGPSNVSFGSNTVCSNTTPNKSKIEIPANTVTTITPVVTNSSHPQYTNSCAGLGSREGGTPSPPPNPTPIPDGQQGGINIPPLIVEPQRPSGLSFEDVPRGSLRADRLYRVIQRMIDRGVFVAGEKFKSKGGTKRLFAMQIALAIANRNCGASISFENCKSVAVANNIVSANNIPPLQIKRVQFYEMLLKASGLPMVSQSQIRQERLCRDVRLNSPYAQIIATARQYRIATVFSGKKCRPEEPFTRIAATTYAARVLEVMDRFAR